MGRVIKYAKIEIYKFIGMVNSRIVEPKIIILENKQLLDEVESTIQNIGSAGKCIGRAVY